MFIEFYKIDYYSVRNCLDTKRYASIYVCFFTNECKPSLGTGKFQKNCKADTLAEMAQNYRSQASIDIWSSFCECKMLLKEYILKKLNLRCRQKRAYAATR